MNAIDIFGTYLLLFSFLGFIRGWAKELLVAFSMILALSLNHIMRRYIPLVSNLSEVDVTLFWMRLMVVVVLAYFGYDTVRAIPQFAVRSTRERIRDRLFGVLMGAFNGYLIFGSAWYYMHLADYFLPEVLSKPVDPNLLAAYNQMMLYMPPQLLGEPAIYLAIIIMFIWVLVVYI